MQLPDLDPLVHQPTRLRIMTVLYRNRRVSYVRLRETLGLTDGNLASHARKLEDAGYVRSRRVLAGLAFEVHYWITDAGVDAFRGYVAALREVIAVSDPSTVAPQES